MGDIARMIASEGHQVWWEADLPPHKSFGEVELHRLERKPTPGLQ